MQKIKKYLMYIPIIIIIIGFVYIQVMTDLKLPEYMASIVDKGIAKQDMGVIKQLGLEMIGIALIGVVATIFASFFSARVAAGISRGLRNDVFEKVESFSLSEFDKFSTASLITRNTNDIQQIQMFIFMFLRMIVSAPIMAVGGIIKAIDTSRQISWILAIAIPVTLVFILVLILLLVPSFNKVQGFIDRLNRVSRENLTGIRVIRAFKRENYEEEKFDEANKILTRTNLYLNRVMVLLMPAIMLLLNFTQLGIIWFGAKAVDSDGLMIGDIMAFINYAMQVMMSFFMLSMVSIILPRALVSWKRVWQVLKTQPTINDPEDAVSELNDSKQETLEFKNVSFSYPNASERVLNNISFKAKKGEITAIIGSTGAGKSTLINLIPRFYDVSDGEILINGIDIRKFKLADLHKKIGYVPQKATLFSGTIESNIKLGLEGATDEEMELASKISQADDFIFEKEEKFQSEIAQGGTNVSGGQKQRLSIARALVRKPEMYIFDDSFSALDFKTDRALRDALMPYTKESITLIVAQRVSTIMKADRIIVLDDGNVVGMGTHKELLNSCEVYNEIATSQLSKEELE